MSAKRNIYRLFILCCLLSVIVITGCIERKLTINTKPQGAQIFLNDEEIGTSPVTVEFNWYGDYKVQAIKQGYDIFNTHRLLKAPAHDSFPLDFFYGVLYPGSIVDEYEWSFDLTPYTPVDRDALIKDAENIRGRALDELKAPIPE